MPKAISSKLLVALDCDMPFNDIRRTAELYNVSDKNIRVFSLVLDKQLFHFCDLEFPQQSSRVVLIAWPAEFPMPVITVLINNKRFTLRLNNYDQSSTLVASGFCE
jgi:hypothetical protein